MIAREYIDKNLQPLSTDASVEDALYFFSEQRISETFIYNAKQELMLLRQRDIFPVDEMEAALPYATTFDLKLLPNIHWSQLLTIFNSFDIGILPLYNDNYEYTGLISRSNLMATLPDFKSMEEPGAIIVLSCEPSFYAASEVIRIAEMYNARIISLLTHLDEVTKQFVITLKINIQETRGISSTYERFGYEVAHVFMNKDFDNDVYIDRYESFLRVFDLK